MTYLTGSRAARFLRPAVGMLLCLSTFEPVLAQDAELPFPLLLEREKLDAGNPLAPYDAMVRLEERYLASPVFRRIYPEIRASFEEFMGVPLAGVRAMSLPTLRREFPTERAAIPDRFTAQDAVEAIVRRAAGTQAVIFGEEHHLPQTRSLYEALVVRLWDVGYRYLAAEAFTDALVDAASEDVDYSSGLYLMDPVFASAVRKARELGYRLIAYDTNEIPPDGTDEPGFRDRRQAENIIEGIFARDPAARVLVLAGRGHASEKPASDGWMPMAAVLKERTGIDPLTLFAPTMSMRATREEEHPLYRWATDNELVRQPTIFADTMTMETLGSESFDAYVFWPRVAVENGREDWVYALPARRRVGIPFALSPESVPLLVQAFARGRPDRAVPDDQILYRGGPVPSLALHPGRYRVRALRADGRAIAEGEVCHGRTECDRP